MNKVKVMELVDAGKILGVAEFRSGEVRKRSGFAKTGGAAYTMVTAVYNVEFGVLPLAVEVQLDKETVVESFKFPAKGSKVVVDFALKAAKGGLWYVNATVAPLAA